MKSIVLFDMDGTLTEPREAMQESMVVAIANLLEKSEVGIVTGSDSDYVFQQCKILLENKYIDKTRLHIFPCNGTKIYKWNTSTSAYENVYAVDMINKLGQDAYNVILSSCLKYQSYISNIHNLPYTLAPSFTIAGLCSTGVPLGGVPSLVKDCCGLKKTINIRSAITFLDCW